MHIVRRELVVPLQLASVRIQSQDTIRKQVVALPVAIHRIGIRISGRPVQRVAFGVIRAGQPCRAAAEQRLGALPGFGAGVPFQRNGPFSPQPFASGRLVGGKESTDPAVPAGDARDDHVVHRQGSDRRAVVLRLVGHVDVPHQSARDSVQGDQVRIVGYHKHFVTQDRHAAVGAERRVADESRSLRARILPDLAASQCIERQGLVRPGNVHHAVGDQGRHFEAKMIDGEDPFHAQILHVRRIDLLEFAVPVAAQVSVVSEPVAWPRIPDSVEVDSSGIARA